MYAIIPENWKCELPDDTGVLRRSVKTQENYEIVRSVLLDGERLFLIGAEGICDSNRFVVATDHISLFGGSPLTGPNRDDLGTRFPSLMNMYIAPEGKWNRGVLGRVPDWRLSTPAELRLLGVEALVSEGIDEAEIAGHAGARVALLVRGHGWESMNTQIPPLLEVATAVMNLHNSRFTGGGEEQ